MWKNTGGFEYDRLVDMLLVSRSGVVEKNAVEVFHHWCSLLRFLFDIKFQILSEKIIIW
jgi:hypothetical protein